MAASEECTREIDGFGTTAPPRHAGDEWLQQLFYEDLGASLLRLDLTPKFRPPVSEAQYNSPWLHGRPPLPGPDGNNVRTYRDLPDYMRSWAGRKAQIVVFGDQLDAQIGSFDYTSPEARDIGLLAQRVSRARGSEVRLVGSIWSPAPWLKESSGNHIDGTGGPELPRAGSPWPFIWAGNFSGGRLDTSDEPRKELNDGKRATSALTQFARSTAAYVLGFQRAFNVKLYALSLQNELNFETFYNSCTYPDAKGYAAALKALRRELDRHPDLRDIQLIGPEDLLGKDAWALWQFGDARDPVHKNLQYLATLARDREAMDALSFVAVHAYANDGVSAAGDDEQMWRWFLDGWTSPPAQGLPERVAGVRSYGKKSWMTELSGETSIWSQPDAARSDSALGLALKAMRGLTVGEQSAWIYWQLVDGRPVHGETLTDSSLRERAPKYVAFKHFARYVRPGSCVQPLQLDGARDGITGSAFRHPEHGTTVVLINTGDAQQVSFDASLLVRGAPVLAAVSRAQALWVKQMLTPDAEGKVSLYLPAEAMVTLVSGKNAR